MSALSLFKCLSDDTRLKSLLLILSQKELCVCDLTQALGLSQPKVSRHLADLRQCEMLTAERRGKWMYYRLHPDLPQWKIDILNTAAHNSRAYLKQAMALLEPSRNCDLQ